MKFTDFIVCDITTTNKRAVIEEMVVAICKAKQLLDVDNIVQAIMKRELMGTTGIGHGIAIPHAKCTGIDDIMGAVGVSVNEVEFESVDAEPCRVFFLLLSPSKSPGDHLRALDKIARVVRQKEFLERLIKAKDKDEIMQIMHLADQLSQ